MVIRRDDSHHHINGLIKKCGAVGIALDGRDAARPLYYPLYALQHQGQESAGIITHDGFRQHSHVQMGPAGDAFGTDDLDGLKGEANIGHVRYPTTGDVPKSCAQPFVISFKLGSLGLAHDSNLVNASEPRDEPENFGHVFISIGDVEAITRDLARDPLEENLVRAVKRTMERIHGSYALTIMHDKAVFGVRDPKGNRPLCIRKVDDSYVLVSELAVIDTLDGELVRDMKPGEFVILEPDDSGLDPYQLVERDNTAHCFFEHIYFTRPDFIMNDALVYEVCRGLGQKLWGESGVNTDVVTPVPGPDRAFVSGYAETAQEDDVTAEFVEGLMKNRYIGRTFITSTQDKRERAVRLKLNLIKNTVEGRSVTPIDDSVVCGATPSQFVQLSRDAGATEAHMHIGAPPIVTSCYMDVNMATREELIASDKSTEEVRGIIDAGSLGYLSIDSVTEVLEKSQNNLCLGCVIGEYPYDTDGEETGRDVSRPVVGAEAPLSDWVSPTPVRPASPSDSTDSSTQKIIAENRDSIVNVTFLFSRTRRSNRIPTRRGPDCEQNTKCELTRRTPREGSRAPSLWPVGRTTYYRSPEPAASGPRASSRASDGNSP